MKAKKYRGQKLPNLPLSHYRSMTTIAYNAVYPQHFGKEVVPHLLQGRLQHFHLHHSDLPHLFRITGPPNQRIPGNETSLIIRVIDLCEASLILIIRVVEENLISKPMVLSPTKFE